MKLCPYCYEKIRWYHSENKVYFQKEMRVMHDACAWRFLLAETQRLRAAQGGATKEGKVKC